VFLICCRMQWRKQNAVEDESMYQHTTRDSTPREPPVYATLSI